MSANFEILENVATVMEKISFCSNLKEAKYQKMFELPDNCAHFTC